MAAITFSGLSTGINFNALADSLIALERGPITQLQTRQTQIKARKELYNDIISSLNAVKTAAENVARPSNLRLAEATTSDTDKLTASADSTAAGGTYEVTVQRLATATRVTSGFATSLGLSAAADTTKTLNSADAHLGATFTDGFVTINGTQVSIDTETDTLNAVIARITANVAGVTASYDAATDRLKLSAASAVQVGASGDTSNFLDLTGLNASEDTEVLGQHIRTGTHRLGRVNASTEMANTSFRQALGASGSFTINGVAVSYDTASDSLNDVINRINTNVTSVVASYDTQADKIVLVSKSTGSLGISRADSSGNFLETMGLLDSTGDARAAVSLGQNAKITVSGYNGGQPVYATSNTISGVIPGVSLNLKQADLANPLTVTVTRNTTDLKNKVQDFVNKYNDTVQLIYSRLTEKPIENATSQTAQRIGLLRGDPLLASVRSQLAQAVTEVVSSLPTNYNRAGNLGITISKTDYKVGTLSFDTAKFDAAIGDNFQRGYNILFQDTNDDGNYDKGEGGVMGRLLDKLTNLVDTTTQSYGGRSAPLGTFPLRTYTLDREYATLTGRIQDLEDRLTVRGDALRKRLLAAESAITRMQQAGSGLNRSA
jgi:flagellar hook-associated protein 2